MKMSMQRLTAFIFFCGYFGISAQQSPMMQKTFAETQFDLDPSLPSEEFSSAVRVPQNVPLPTQQFPFALQEPAVPTATMIRSPSAPADIYPQFQKQLSSSTAVAPRAKPFHTPVGNAASLFRTQPPVFGNAVGIPDRLSPSVPRGLPPPDISKASAVGIQNPTPNPNRALPVVQVASAQATPVASSVPQPRNKTFLAETSSPSPAGSVALNPLAAPSVALGGITFGSAIPVQRRISSASLWFNETFPSTGLFLQNLDFFLGSAKMNIYAY